jgi:hypothetical protein
MAETWLLCSACRSDIAFGAKYFQCSVSTCNRARTRLVFCSVACWDSHVATLRHRDAWAEDKIAPTQAAWERELASEPREPARAMPTAPRPAPAPPVIARPASPPPGEARPAPSIPAAASVPASSIPRSDSPPPATARRIVSEPAPAPAPAPARRIVGEPAPAPPGSSGPEAAGVHLHDIVDRDMLIVISKLKKYIKDRSGMNCSDAVAEVLSDHVRALCDDSIRAAGRDERKTVLDRDVPRPRRYTGTL